jgi:hypothetical protein
MTVTARNLGKEPSFEQLPRRPSSAFVTGTARVSTMRHQPISSGSTGHSEKE